MSLVDADAGQGGIEHAKSDAEAHSNEESHQAVRPGIAAAPAQAVAVAPQGVSTAASEYSAFVAAQLAEERTTKTSLESRGITVITTSGGLVTLLFGLVALATKEAQTYTLPALSTQLLVAAAIALTAAGVLGLLTNFAFGYEEASIEGLRGLLGREWGDSQLQGQVDVATTNIAILEAARNKNALKAWILRFSMLAEVVGVGLVAAAAIVVLVS